MHKGAKEFLCEGSYDFHSQSIHCHNRYGHGWINFHKAIEVSCNPYFINAGIQTGLENILKVLKPAGIGRRPGTGLPQEGRGILPSRQRYPRWNAGETAYISIGQGKISISPLQAAVFLSALANGGTVVQPQLVRGTSDPISKEIIRSFSFREKGSIFGGRTMSDDQVKNLAMIKKAMRQVVIGSQASAPVARIAAIDLAGKTGTAQTGSSKKSPKNCWFLSFGPYEDPKYSLVILIEDGLSGGKSAAPLAADFFEEWLSGEKNKKRE